MHNYEYFVFDGIDSRSVGLRLEDAITFDGAAPNVEAMSIPGRNGALHYFDGAYGNVTGSASCFVLQKNVDKALAAIDRWLLLGFGYKRLEVATEPDYFRMARVSDGPGTEIRTRKLAVFDLKFDCKPQKFLKSGEETITITEATTLQNEWFPALPLLKVYGSSAAVLAVGDTSISISEIDEYVVLDCELQDAYKGTANKNSTITAPEFPRLENGENAISWTGGITKIEITPRWWTL
ncbi:MAG: hypothetical protein LUE22_00900 [Oscillospiraceae bacterium]|nr:hypothetical protein [Oscillospiraceae bacterium]